MINALRTAICVVIGMLMASTLCFMSFDQPHPLHGIPYILAVALAINATPGKGPSPLTGMVAGLMTTTAVYTVLVQQGLYKELWLVEHTPLSAFTVVLCIALVLIDRPTPRIATYDGFPPVGAAYGLLTVASVALFSIGRDSELFTVAFEILRRLIVYATLMIFCPGLVLAVVLNFFKPRHVTPREE